MNEVTYEAIRKANETIRTTTLKRENKKTGEVTSKEYAEVNQRIKAFRMVYPIGLIHTHMLSNENGICIFRAEKNFLIIQNANYIFAMAAVYSKR